MLPRSQRVRLTADIQTIYSQGVKAHHSLLRMSALPSAQPHSRATVVVSKRVHLHATVRNRLKRRVRASLRTWLPKLPKAYDLVVVGQPKAAQASAAELHLAVEHLLRKLQLL